MQNNNQSTICIFGDSITYGAWDLEKGGWVNRLRLYLDNNKFYTEVYNLGISGDTTSDLLKRFDVELETRKPGKIIFSIGNNDSVFLDKEKCQMTSIEKFEENIKTLILKSKKQTPDIVFTGLTPVDEDKTSPIPWATDKTYKNQYIKIYNDKIQEICDKEKVKFIDLYNNFIKLKNYKELLSDGLHPNSDGHQLIFEIIKQNIF
ncbi:MAG: GDSL-type esterase/lipase family protein [bacterium]